MYRHRLIVFLAGAVLLAACGAESTDSGATPATTNASPTATVVAPESPTTVDPAPTELPAPDPTSPPATPEPTITIELTRLGALADGAVYEVWLVVGAETVSVGSFDSFENAPSLPLAGIDPSNVSLVVVTVETDNDPAPSASRVLAGEVIEGVAVLTTMHSQALGLDFTSSAGEYILATPTDGTGASENERSGIWWTFIPRAQSLVLPILPPGWIYEGWQLIDGVPVSSGTFASQFGQADNSARFSGPQPGPPLPGEDFLVDAPDGLTFPRDLRGSGVAISIEPFPDDGPDPFSLTVLRGVVPDDAIDHTSYSVENVSSELPEGLATFG